MEHTSATRRWVNALLAVFLLLGTALMFFAGVVPNWEELLHAVTYKSELSPYLPENGRASALDLFSARVRALDGKLSSTVYRAEELGQFNASVQYLMGKRLVTTGSQQMVRLNGGYLYDLQEETSMQSAADEIIALARELPEEIPFLFVYEHNTVYDPDMLPAGYDVLDWGKEAADEVTQLLRAGGLNVIDSRDVLTGSGYSIDSYLMRTDQHWATFAALLMSKDLAEWMQNQGLDVDPELLAADAFETETLPKLFLGKYGQRIGTNNIDPDDIHLFYPTYETSISRHSVRPKSENDASGDFAEAVIRADRLKRDESGYNIKAYGDYGLSEVSDQYHNDLALDQRILIFKDSYSAPIAAFLSLVASDVYAVDLRQTDKGAMYYVEDFQPDVIIMAYSQQMLRDRDYAFEN